jgi:cholesterol transport system auxiliary component
MILSLATACLSLEKSYPDKQLYVLDPQREAAPGTPVAGTVLKIKLFRVSPQYEGKGLVYRYDRERVQSDFYEEYFVAPSPMVTECVRRWFTEAGLFGNVVDISSPVLVTHLLEGSVKAMYADLRTTPPAAVLEMQFFLLDETGDAARIVYQKSFSQAVPIKDATGPSIITGLNQALATILTTVEADLRPILAGSSSSPGVEPAR